MYKKEHLLHLLRKIEMTLARIIENSKEIDSYHFYYLTSAGMERLESTCMLLTQVSQVQNLWYKSNKEGISPPKGEL